MKVQFQKNVFLKKKIVLKVFHISYFIVYPGCLYPIFKWTSTSLISPISIVWLPFQQCLGMNQKWQILKWISQYWFILVIQLTHYQTLCQQTSCSRSIPRYRSFSTYAKFSEKLTFLTRWYTQKFCVRTKWMIPNNKCS